MVYHIQAITVFMLHKPCAPEELFELVQGSGWLRKGNAMHLYCCIADDDGDGDNAVR